MPAEFRLKYKSVRIVVNETWSLLFLKQLVCLELDCEPHSHFLAYQGAQLADWDKVSRYDFLLADNVAIDVLPHTNIYHYYVLCYTCNDVTPAVFSTICDKCLSSEFTVSSALLHPEIRTVSGNCNKCCNSSAKVVFACSKDCSHSPVVFLKNVVRNLDRSTCIACCGSDAEIVVTFCKDVGHILCLDCFRTYAESYLSDMRFEMVPDIGYTLRCPVGCPESYIPDTHIFRVLGESFYSFYKMVAARSLCYNEGYFSCPECGNFWERPGEPKNSTWFICEEPYGCGAEFCVQCGTVVSCDGSLSRCMCGGSISVGKGPLGTASSLDGHPETWTGVKLTPSELASCSLIAVTCKPCPRCRSQTAKDGGCNHVTCSQCGLEWCWICLSSWTGSCQSSHWF
ncbi:unnamed protein product [Mesocestoides corti]|uniref:RBR-type E3 ubiquitin transferase n=1 Tax=Mesocestoides corti TaxID=53468 RepID=A0A0R3U127_MESCO|nr:unnamed protein product [Mesocestoides corti]